VRSGTTNDRGFHLTSVLYFMPIFEQHPLHFEVGLTSCFCKRMKQEQEQYLHFHG
ncbi:unnamed protein product, partial [Dicrocoelium dendriticum]